MNLKQLIGEATDYDKKIALEERRPKSWCKSISAFANCYGGRLIFGVSNDIKLFFEKDEEKLFVIVEVRKGQQTPDTILL